MKKKLLAGAFASLCLTMSAQTSGFHAVMNPGSAHSMLFHTPHSKSITCGNDTVLYPLLKEQSLGTPTFYSTDLYDLNYTQVAQAYANTGSLTIKGISFIGSVTDYVNPAQTMTATLELYNVDGTNTPTTLITSANVTITTVQSLYSAMFSTPVTVTGNYAVAVTNTSTTDTIGVILNNASTTTYGEALGSLGAPGFPWAHSNAVYGGTYDVEP